MKTERNYKFYANISNDAYFDKQCVHAAIEKGVTGRELRKQFGLKHKMSFREQLITCEELLEYALNGHSFCALFEPSPNTHRQTFKRKDGSLTLSGKTLDFFAESFFIGVDVEKTSYTSIEAFVSRLQLQPSFWYTSMSHQQLDEDGENKGCRFRLIYVFDRPITDIYFFRFCSFTLHSMIEQDIQETIHDKCGLQPTQYFNGTNWSNTTLNVDYGITNNIYNLDDL